MGDSQSASSPSAWGLAYAPAASSQRSQLRYDLDAAFFHLYGISRDDAAYILDTFPIVKRRDEDKWGIYRTKDTILEIYAALAACLYPPDIVKPYRSHVQI